MAGIPSSAIKLYSSSSGGTLITTGSSGATVYARIPNSFVENYTLLNRTVTIPYCGKISLSGTKSISCNNDLKTVSVTLPATAETFDTSSNFGLSSISITVESGSGTWDALTSTLSVGMGEALIKFTLYDNAWSVGINGDSLDGSSGAALSDFYIDSLLMTVGEHQVIGDPGRVCTFPITFKLHVPANTTGSPRNLDYFTFYHKITQSDVNVSYNFNVEQE